MQHVTSQVTLLHDQNIRSQRLRAFLQYGQQSGIQAIHALRLQLILAMLEQARTVNDMDAPALRLHALKGDMNGYMALTVQANWRVIFKFENGDAHVVDYLDYH